MQHAWIFDVLADLRSYAEMNDLPAIAAAAEQTLGVAKVELAALAGDGDGQPPAGNT